MESKTQGSPWALREPLACPKTQMWTLTIMDKGVIENVYHVTTMNEFELDDSSTYSVKNFSKP